VGRVHRLVLAAQAVGDDGGQAAEDQAFGIDDEPLPIDVCRFGRIGFHPRESDGVAMLEFGTGGTSARSRAERAREYATRLR